VLPGDPQRRPAVGGVHPADPAGHRHGGDRPAARGVGDGAQPTRALTDIESSLLRELVQRVLRELDYAFESLVKTSTSIVQLESNPQFAQIAAASDMVVAATYDVRIGARESTATLCIPFASLQPILENVTGNAHFADRKGTDPVESARAVAAGLTAVPVDVSVRFDAVRLTSSQILDLEVGRRLPLRHPVSTPLSVVAGTAPVPSASRAARAAGSLS
jgi:flagellar motor switch protein FliM